MRCNVQTVHTPKCSVSNISTKWNTRMRMIEWKWKSNETTRANIMNLIFVLLAVVKRFGALPTLSLFKQFCFAFFLSLSLYHSTLCLVSYSLCTVYSISLFISFFFFLFLFHFICLHFIFGHNCNTVPYTIENTVDTHATLSLFLFLFRLVRSHFLWTFRFNDGIFDYEIWLSHFIHNFHYLTLGVEWKMWTT